MLPCTVVTAVILCRWGRALSRSSDQRSDLAVIDPDHALSRLEKVCTGLMAVITVPFGTACGSRGCRNALKEGIDVEMSDQDSST